MCRSMVDIQSATAEIRRGKEEERKKKKQDKTIMSASATQGGHKKNDLGWSSNSRSSAISPFDSSRVPVLYRNFRDMTLVESCTFFLRVRRKASAWVDIDETRKTLPWPSYVLLRMFILNHGFRNEYTVEGVSFSTKDI